MGTTLKNDDDGIAGAWGAAAGTLAVSVEV
jgi:hypothetical protein